MKATTFIAAVAAAGLAAAPALAQSTPSSSTPPSAGQANSGSTASIGQTLKQDLEKAGFKDVQIMPETFVVRAKNSSGQPVLMQIGPDTVTEVTAVPNQGGNPGTSGSPSTASK